MLSRDDIVDTAYDEYNDDEDDSAAECRNDREFATAGSPGTEGDFIGKNFGREVVGSRRFAGVETKRREDKCDDDANTADLE